MPAEERTVLIANPSADLYGSDRMMLESVIGLTARGWRVVVTCSAEGPLVGALRATGAEVRVQRVPVIRKSMLSAHGVINMVGQVITELPPMLRLVRQVRPSVVLVSTVTIPLWLVVARLFRVPAVVHVHEAEASLSGAARLGLSAPLALASRVVFNSEVSRQVSGSELLERRGRIRVVHNGVRAPQNSTPARTILETPFRVVYVGRLSPRKGVDLVVQAASELIKQGLETEVDIVGSAFTGYEWYENELRMLVSSLGLDSRVHFHGFQESVWPFLADADVAVVPSRLDESFGNTLVESLLAGRPVVASDHTGLREAARGFEGVVLVKTGEVDALTGGLTRIRKHWDEYRLKATTDAMTARRRYSPDRFQLALSNVLNEAVTAVDRTTAKRKPTTILRPSRDTQDLSDVEPS